jgi:hypothetical protein
LTRIADVAKKWAGNRRRVMEFRFGHAHVPQLDFVCWKDFFSLWREIDILEVLHQGPSCQ